MVLDAPCRPNTLHAGNVPWTTRYPKFTYMISEVNIYYETKSGPTEERLAVVSGISACARGAKQVLLRPPDFVGVGGEVIQMRKASYVLVVVPLLTHSLRVSQSRE